MKKQLLMLLLLSSLWSYAQVRDYTFSQSVGTYTEITGGTALGTEGSDTQYFVDPTVPMGGSVTYGVGFPIGFNFTFNGFVYDSFAVATDGWISLGSSAVTPNAVNCAVTNSYYPLSSVSTTAPAELSAKIAALAKDLSAQAGASIRCQTIGDAPNRVLVVQWKKYRKTGSLSDDFNFQIRLNETSNTVDVMYGPFFHDVVLGGTCQVGLRAEPVAVASNFVNRKTTVGWAETVAGTVATDAVKLGDLTMPASGLTFTWTPSLCGGAKGVVVSNILTNGATLTWGAYPPIPTSYEYIVSKSATLPLPTDSGTETNDPSAIVSGLDPFTSYNVYLRAKCTTGFTPWYLGAAFKTACLDAVTYFEDFDTYNGATTYLMPDCWSSAGTGSAYITSGAVSPMTPLNRLYMFAAGNGVPTVSYAVMPPVSNLQAGTHRLRFNALSTSGTDRKLDVGYFSTAGDLNSFTLLQTINLPGTDSASAKNFVVTPGVIPPGVQNLVFRNKGIPTGSTTLYIDDVIYEPIPTCNSVSAISLKELTNSSVKVSWEKGGSETEWQYLWTPSTVLNPDSKTPVTYSGVVTTVAIDNLSPATTYRIWLRSKCGDNDYGAWIGSAVFTTTCSPTGQFMENFDAVMAVPSCWTRVGTNGTVQVLATAGIPSGPNALFISSNSATNLGILALPPLSNANTGTHRLRFMAKAGAANANLEIGYVTDMSNPNSFQTLQTVTVGTTWDKFMVALGAAPQSSYLALRGGVPYTYIYLDDVAWEPNPICSDITSLAVTEVHSTSAGFSWTAGGSENGWQYAIGEASLKDPFSLTAVNVSNPATIVTALSPATNYKVWVRSKCSDTNLGAWMGPVTFSTNCSPDTAFTQNFDGSTTMPACWSKVNSKGAVSIQNTVAPSAPYALQLTASNSTGTALAAMPAVSNSGAGTHRLRFKVRASLANSNLQVGYLLNYTDPTSFVQLYTGTISQTATYESKVVELGQEPESEHLAFRNPINGTGSSSFFIDDVIWEKIPTCFDVSNIMSSDVTGSTANMTWAKGGSETKWEYVITTSSVTDPNALTPVEVSSNAVTISGLKPVTLHKFWVRSKCSANDAGIWVGPFLFTTGCTLVNEFVQNFDAGTSLPTCWTKYTNGSGSVYGLALADAPTKTNVLVLSSSSTATSVVAQVPPIANISAADHVLKFKYKASVVGSMLEVGYVSIPGDGNSFVPIKSIPVGSTTAFEAETISLGASPMSNLLAFRNTGAVSGMIYLDDVSWDVKPTTVPVCSELVTAVPDVSCGNFATMISWSAAAGADSYKLTVGTTPGGSDVLNNQDVAGLSYSLLGNANTKYYYTVKPYNSIGVAATCVEKSYTTNVNKCYCTSNPSYKDGAGVTNVELGGSNFVGSALTYYNFTGKPVNLAKGANTNLKITFNTGSKSYKTYVWIDFNDNYNFEASELVVTGTSGTSAPNILDLSFLMPADAPLGTYRMRIGTSYFANLVLGDPCFSGNYAVTLDFKVGIVTPVANDTPAGATPLTVGADFTANATTGTNANSTGSLLEPIPACGVYNGMDVWYSATVPASGNLTFEVRSIAGGLTNTAAAAYSGNAAALTLLSCNDSGSTAGDDHPKIGLTGRTVGEVVYFRVWENGGDALGAFKASAYDSALGVDTFESNNFSYFPNPVKDLLYLSLDQEMSNVNVVNLLGQQVFAKEVNANQSKIDMSQLAAGTYFVKVTVGNQLKTIKVVKE